MPDTLCMIGTSQFTDESGLCDTCWLGQTWDSLLAANNLKQDANGIVVV